MIANSGNDPIHLVIDAKLAEVVAALPTVPAWYQPWIRLGREATGEDRLAVYQAVRDAGTLPEDAGFRLVAWQIDAIAAEQPDAALDELEDRLEALRKTHGQTEGGAPSAGEDEYAQIQQRYYDAWDALYANKLDEFGEQEMARLFRTDRERFEERNEAGRQFFVGAEPRDGNGDPLWLDALLEAVGACMEADSPMGPLGWRYGEEAGFWEIVVYPTQVELVGGADDGAVVWPGFSVDLEQLRSVFDSVTAMGWNALGLHDPDSPYVYVEGIYDGHEVFLRVLAQAPEEEEPGMKIDATNRQRQGE